ncbi:MAG: translocation/assembly module TamB [Dysgonamonadaceae bacterium]|nr:translocation/assembly module TamB [Dysgonamonadaceae bacterium]
MKHIKRIVWGILIFICVFYVLPVFLLQIPFVQRFASQKVSAYLGNRIGSKVEIKQIEPGFLGELIIKDVYVEDLSGETLLKAKRIAVGFDILPLFKKKLRFRTCQIFTFEFNLSRETADAPLNIQPVIDAFFEKDTLKKPESVDIQIKKLILRRGKFSYQERDTPVNIGKFNSKSFFVNDISTKIVFGYYDGKEIGIDVKQLSFTASEGLKLNDLNFDLKVNKDNATISSLQAKLDDSEFSFSDISFTFRDENGQRIQIKKIPFKLTINDSKIYFNEISAFFPSFAYFDDRIDFRGDFKGSLSDISVSGLHIQMGDDLIINTSAETRDILSDNPEEKFIYVDIDNSYFTPDAINLIINNFSENSVKLPKQIYRMKTIHYTGEVSGSPSLIISTGTLKSAVGTLLMNIEAGRREMAFIRGQVRSDSLNLAILMNNNCFGNSSFDLRIDASQQADKHLAGLVDGTVKKLCYKGYCYENIELNGKFSPDSYNGILSINTPDGKIDTEGLFQIREDDSEFNFSANITDLHPNRLNLTDKFKDLTLSFGLTADFAGNNADNIFGAVVLKNLSIKTNKGEFLLDTLYVQSEKRSEERVLTINSRLLKGELIGDYNFATLVPDIKNTFAAYLPAIFKSQTKKTNGIANTFSLNLVVEDMQEISDVMSLPFAFRDKTLITGHYNSFYNRFDLDVDIPLLTIGKSTISNVDVALNNRTDTASLKVNGTSLHRKNGRMPFYVGFDAADNQINTLFDWGQKDNAYRGQINFKTLLLRNTENEPLNVDVQIKKSNMVFNDSLWTLQPTHIIVDTEGIAIKNLQATHNKQFVKIDGVIAHNPDRKLLVELNDVDLEYIFNSLNIKALEFGGNATGYVYIQDIYKTRILSTHLGVKDFSFNRGLFGDLDLTGTWDSENQGVIMKGIVQKSDSKVNIDGVIYPGSETLSINFDADRANARFLRKYLNKVAKDIDGSFSGHLRLFGNLNDPTVEGTVFAHKCRFGIDFLNTYYTFSDTVYCLPDEIRIKNVRIFDEKGKTALANAYVKHNLFSDFHFLADVSFDDFMVYNADRNLNPTFFGTAFGTGNARLEGTENIINIAVSLRNTANTRMSLNFMEAPDVVDYDFIRFVSNKKDSAETKTTADQQSVTAVSTANEQGTELRLNLMLEANQQATLDMVMDPVSGDKISGYGNGNLQIQYGDKIPLRVFGTYTIDRGKYNYGLYQAIYRNFDITEGSTVSFSGDPYIAELNITANYTVQANLGDLDQRLVEQQQSAKSNIPVNCVLKLNGALNRPGIAFDIDLPNSTAELNRQVKSYIRTDDMLSQQFVYLLVLSRFYTSPEYMREGSQVNNNMSYFTSTLSSQLSQMLGTLSDKFQVGAKYHQSYEQEQTSTEMELLLSSRLLDDRLLINGNFGYIDRPYLHDENRSNIPLIGDFDLEYLLQKNGNIRLKFFNHYNYRYLSPRPEMTQGFGIQFRRDFNNVQDIFIRKKR